MNRNYADEALDKAGEFVHVIHTKEWQLFTEAFFEVADYEDEYGTRRADPLDQELAASRVLSGRGSKDSTELAKYAWGEVGLALRDGEVFAVDPDIVDLISSAVGTMPPYPLRMDDAPSQHGFVWLPDGLVMPDVRGAAVFVRAMTWTSARNDDTGERGYVINVFTDPFDERDSYHDRHMDVMRQGGKKVSSDMRQALHWSIIGQWIWQEGRELPPSESCSEAMWFVAALWRFVHEPYVEHRSILPSKHARRRAARSDVDPDRLRVVRLRKAEHKPARSPGEGEGEGQEWSHRWIVHGHWRNQWYPSIQEHRPKWIPPYVKGPEGKPLIVKDVAYLVDR